MTMWDELEEVRDLLRTGLPPSYYTMDAWNQHKCERAASMLDRMIKRHDDAVGGTKAEREKRKQLKTKAQLRDHYRNSVCIGCHNNRYNFQSEGDGWNAPTSGEGCWSLTSIRRGVCTARRAPY